MHTGNLAGTQLQAAPSQKAGSKMRTGRHFEGRSDKGGGGKISAFLGSSFNNFGVHSAKMGVINAVDSAPRVPGISVQQLQEHNRVMQYEVLRGTIMEEGEEMTENRHKDGREK